MRHSKDIRRRAGVLFLSVALLLLCVACGRETAAPRDLLEDFSKIYGNMPAGQVYLDSATEWETAMLSPTLADARFREDNGENAFSLCKEYAVFLASAHTGGEIAFLRAAGQEDAIQIAEMCAARIARARRTIPESPILDGACVLRRGRTVVLLMMPDNAIAKSVCQKLL